MNSFDLFRRDSDESSEEDIEQDFRCTGSEIIESGHSYSHINEGVHKNVTQIVHESAVPPRRTQVYLGTSQGRIGMANPSIRDHGIHGCTMLCSLIASSFLVGISSIALIDHIIDNLSQILIPPVRKKEVGYKNDYSFINVKSAFNGLCDLRLLEVN